jgi:hypothetical protein
MREREAQVATTQMGRMGAEDPPRASGQEHRLMAGDLGERFGVQGPLP